ncbi:hypothetical protein FB382_003857 [Nocardioides ginsengisegetis]|uniref:ROK family protein n=1 Tax=Nocardioides ginsengisegetis TaxID=661491 RepID=A0A7W3J3E8_9ACTN|nr:hypothetical protein [Nocardioides ginsengisegetis]
MRATTPKPSTPEAVAEVFAGILEQFPDSRGPVGVTVPGVVRHGVVHSAANIDKSWLGTDADALFTKATGRDVHVVNDADAAGLAEVRYGAARGRDGLVIVTTLGTGIGSALVYDGVLVPNSELGHLEIDGHGAEKRAANSARESEDLSWAKWAQRLTTYYRTLEMLFSHRPLRRGRRDQQEVRRVPAADRHRHRDRPGDTAQQGRDRRGRALRDPLTGTRLKTRLRTRRAPSASSSRRGSAWAAPA